MVSILKRLAFSLSLGLLCASAIGTRFDPEVAIGSGAAASAFGYAGAAFAARVEQRQTAKRPEEDARDA